MMMMSDRKYVAPELKEQHWLWRSTEFSTTTSQVTSLFRNAVDNGLRSLGYERIKTKQLDAAESLLSGEYVFLSIPTRFGKYLVY